MKKTFFLVAMKIVIKRQIDVSFLKRRPSRLSQDSLTLTILTLTCAPTSTTALPTWTTRHGSSSPTIHGRKWRCFSLVANRWSTGLTWPLLTRAVTETTATGTAIVGLKKISTLFLLFSGSIIWSRKTQSWRLCSQSEAGTRAQECGLRWARGLKARLVSSKVKSSIECRGWEKETSELAYIFKSHQKGIIHCLDGTGPCKEEDLCGQLCPYVGQVNYSIANMISNIAIVKWPTYWSFQIWLWRAWLWLGISWKSSWFRSWAWQGRLHPPDPGKLRPLRRFFEIIIFLLQEMGEALHRYIIFIYFDFIIFFLFRVPL